MCIWHRSAKMGEMSYQWEWLKLARYARFFIVLKQAQVSREFPPIFSCQDLQAMYNLPRSLLRELLYLQ